MNWTGRIFLGFLGSTLMRLVDIAMFVAIYIYVANHPAQIGTYKQWVMESLKSLAIHYKMVDPTTFAGQSVLQLIGLASDFISSWPIFFGLRIALGIILTQIFWPWRKKTTAVVTTTPKAITANPKKGKVSKKITAVYILSFVVVTLGIYLYRYQRHFLEAYPAAEWTLAAIVVGTGLAMIAVIIHLLSQKKQP